MEIEMSWGWLKNDQRRWGLDGQLEPAKGGGPGSQPSKPRSPWKAQFIGALIGLGVFIVVGGILWLLYARFR